MGDDFENSTSESNRKDKLILELKEIIQEYESRLNSKDKNFQLQFSELQNELFMKETDLAEINNEKCKMESQLIDLQDLVEDNKVVIQSKDLTLQVIQEDLKAQLENVRSHYIETLSIRQEEIEMLRSTGSQLREQLALRENDMIQLMQRHENQIINLFNDTRTKNEPSDMDRMVNALKDQITDIRGVLIEKQELLKVTNKKLDEQDQLVRQLQERNLNLEKETKKYEQMKHTDQTYESHIKQLNESIKESKKRQLTSKAKTKSLEKQLASLQDHSMKKENDLKNELVIRERIIEKQNILIEELRQTENSLRQSLNRSLAVQDEQILELKYWEQCHKLVPDFEKSYSDESYSTDPLKMAIENLEQLCISKGDPVKEEIKAIIAQLSSYHSSIDDRNKYIIHLENQLNLLSNCISKINKLNINLNKYIGVLVHDYQKCHTLLLDINDEIKDNQDLEFLDQCTNTELIRKLIIATNQACNYNDQLAFLENENLLSNLELNKIIEICCKMSMKIETIFQDIKASLNMTITNINENNLFAKSPDVSASSYIENLFLRISEENKLIQLEIENNISKLNLENIKISESVQKHISDLDFEIVKMKNLSNNQIEKVNKIQNSKIEMDMKQIMTNQEIRNELKVMNADNQILINSEENYKNTSFDDDFQPNTDNSPCRIPNTIKDEAIITEKVIVEKEQMEYRSLIESLNDQLSNLQMVVNELNINEIKFKEELENSLKISENATKELDMMRKTVSVLEKDKEENESLIYTLNNELLMLKNTMEEMGVKERNYKEDLVMVTEGRDKIIKELENMSSIVVAMNIEKDENDFIINGLNNQLSNLNSSIEEISVIETKCKEDLKSAIEDRESILKELENTKMVVVLIEGEKSEKDLIINDLKNEIKDLKIIVQEINSSEIKSKEEMKVIKADNENLLKEIENVKSSIIIYEKEREEKIFLVAELNNKLVTLNNAIEEMSVRETKGKEELGSIIEDRENILKELENIKSTVVLMEVEKSERDSVINNLKNQVIDLKTMVHNVNTIEINYKEEMLVIKEKNASLLKELEDIKNSKVLCEKEREEKESLFNDLNSKLSTLNNTMEELSLKEKNCKDDLANITEDRENIIKELVNMKNIVVLIEGEKSEKDSIINDLKNQIVNLKAIIDKVNADEINSKEEMKIMKEENEDLLKEVEDAKISLISYEKEREEKESLFNDLNNKLLTLNDIVEEISIREVKYKDDLIIVTDDRDNILKELEDMRCTILAKDEEKEENNLIIAKLNNKLSVLNNALDQMSLNETIYKHDLEMVIEGRNNIEKELESAKRNIVAINTQIDEKDLIIYELNDRLSKLNNSIEEMGMREGVLEAVTEDRNNIMKELENMKTTVIVLENERSEKDLIINDFNCQVLKFNDAIEKRDLTYNDDLATVTEDRGNLMKELENMKTLMVAMEKEKEENDLKIIDLNYQLSKLNNAMEEMCIREINYKDDLASATETQGNLMTELENMKNIVSSIESERNENNLTINKLNDKLLILNNTMEELALRETNAKSDLVVVAEIRENLMKELESVNSILIAIEAEKDEKDLIINELNNQLTMVYNIIEEMNVRETNCKEDLTSVIEHRENILKELENTNSTVVQLNEAKSERDSIINDLRNEIIDLKTTVLNINATEINSKEEMKVMKAENESLLKEVEDVKRSIVIYEKEKEEKISLITELNNKLAMLNNTIEEMSVDAMNYKEDLASIIEDRENALKELENMRSIVGQMEGEKLERDSIINDLKNQMMDLKAIVENVNACEISSKKEMEGMKGKNEDLLREIEEIKSSILIYEKEKEEKTTLITELNNKLSMLNNTMEEMSVSKMNCKEDLASIIEDRENILKELENIKSVMALLNEEKSERDLIINDLKNQIVDLKTVIHNVNASEIISKEEMKVTKAQNESLLKELEVVKRSIVIYEKEKGETYSLINELNNKSEILNNVIENMAIKEVEYKTDLASVTEDQENLVKELENMKSALVAMNLEKFENDSIINELNIQLSKLKNIEEDMYTRESNYKDNLAMVNGDRENVMRELEDMKMAMVAMDKEMENKDLLINNIETQMVELKMILRSANDNEIYYQEEMAMIKQENNNLLRERDEKSSLINELKNKLSTLNNILEEMDTKEINYKKDLATVIQDRKNITDEFDSVKRTVLVMEKEKLEKDLFIHELNDKLSKLNNALEENGIKEANYRVHLTTIVEDRENITKELENMKSAVIEMDKEKDEKDAIINELSYQLSKLNNAIEETNAREKKTILQELEVGKSLMMTLEQEKEIVANELRRTKENLNSLNLENSKNVSLISETTVENERLLLELNNKNKKIDEIEKSCLVLKAKLIKLKNQSDQKINILTAERDELIQKLITKEEIVESVFPTKSPLLCASAADLDHKRIVQDINGTNLKKVDRYSQCNILESNNSQESTVKSIKLKHETYISNLKIDNFDEKSLFNQIEHLSDQVDAKVRKMNYEIEEFLEQNEKVTSSLISKASPNHNSSCSDTQCKKLSLKTRELSNTIKNLQEQNQLMKNKMLDLYKYLEKEQEIHNQVNEEDCRINNELTEKLNTCTDENVKLHGQVTHLEKELKILKQEKQRNTNKIANLQSDLSNMSLKHSNLSIEHTNLLEGYQSIRSKIGLEYSSRFEQMQSELILSESTNVQNTKKLSDLENDRFELRKINKKLSNENNEFRQSLQLIDRECNKCKTHINEIEVLNKRIADLVGNNDGNLGIIRKLKNRVEHLEECIKSNEITEILSNRHFLESILSMMNDLGLFISNWKLEQTDTDLQNRYDHFFETNEIIKNQMQHCLHRAECVNSIVDELLSERNGLREKVQKLEMKKSNVLSQCHSLEVECLASNKAIADYQSMLIIEKGKTERLENCLIAANAAIIDYETQKRNHETKLETTSSLDLGNEDCPIVEEFTAIKSTSTEVLASEQLENNCLLVERNNQQYVLNKLSNYFSIELTFVDGKIVNDFEETFEEYMKMIEKLTTSQLSISQRVDRCVQTSVDYACLKKLECDLSNSMKECAHLLEGTLINDPSSSVGWIMNLESHINSVKILNQQIDRLENDLQIEEQRKYEISDRFEQIIMELETACDAEVEKLKLTNELLRQQIQSLQTLREEQDKGLNCLRNQILELQLELSKSSSVCEKEKLVDAIVDTSDNPLSWISNLNDALKETISEKEDQITELMKQYNESTNKIKEARLKEESQCLEIQVLTNKIELVSVELKNKDNSIKESLDVINELEVMCVEKDNRISSLEKELAEINSQMEQYISALCSMQARLEASKPNIESMINRMDNRSNSLQLLNLIDQLEKDYALELEQSEMSKSKLEIKLNKAIQIIHKLKKQLKQSHIHIWKLNDEIKGLKLHDSSRNGSNEITMNETDSKETIASEIGMGVIDVSTQIDFEDEAAIFKEENANFKGIIENLHVNNFILWRELDNIRKSDRNVRGSSLPPGISNSKTSGKNFGIESERSLSPVSQISSNSIEGDSINLNQVKDLQRKLHRTTQQLNQMRVERNRIHQEYTRIRQLKEEGDQKILDLLKHIDANVNQDSILHEKDQLIEINNKYSAKVVELQAEVDMTTVRNSILETKCKKMEWKLNNQRRKYDLLILKLDEKEQEIDRFSDDIRRNNSAFEKERLELLREKRELKLSNKNKDEKISNFRKRLSMKTKETNEKNEKEKSSDDSTENDYLSEIEQLRGELNQQKLESKRCLIQSREEIMKYKGHIEELIDDNRQLKRKLSFDQQESKMNFVETSPTNRYPGGSLMQKIDEAVESLDYSKVRNNADSSTAMAKVVLEKEQLIQLLVEKEEQLNNEKRKSDEYQQEVMRLNDIRERRGESAENKIIQTDESCQPVQRIDKSIQIMDDDDANIGSNNKLVAFFDASVHINASNSSDNIEISSQRGSIEKSVQTNELCEHFTIDKHITQSKNSVHKDAQTMNDFSKYIINEYRQIQLDKLQFRTPVEIEYHQSVIFHHSHAQTDDTTEYGEYLLHSSKLSFQSVANQTDLDSLANMLRNEIIENDKISQLKRELHEAGKEISRLEVKSLEYLEIINKSELEIIEIGKKYNQEITELKYENEKLNVKELVDESIQVDDSEFKDELDNGDLGNMDSNDHMGNIEEQEINKYMILPVNTPSCFLTELERILNSYPDNSLFQEIRKLMPSHICTHCNIEVERQLPSNNANIANLVLILREEITQLKQSLNEKNHEIGQLKSLRNQLQSELLESGQQIKESNMEFLNLKESIQAITVEKDILIQKREDLEMRFKQLVHFNRMISFDLRRLRNSSPLPHESLSGNIFDEENVISVTQSLEHELHKLLEQIFEKDINLEKAINQGLEGFDSNDLVYDRKERIEHLNCSAHQQQHKEDSNTVSSKSKIQFKSEDPNDHSPSTTNGHEECQHLFAEVSDLLDERQVEIEELKNYKMKQEYLTVNKGQIPSWMSLNETVIENSHKTHSKVLVESQDDGQFSDSDYQTVVSPDGSTIIRVERIARVQNSCQHRIFNRVLTHVKCKVVNRLKAAAFTGGRRIFSFRSQPRLNIKTLLTIYMIFIHFLLLRCSFL